MDIKYRSKGQVVREKMTPSMIDDIVDNMKHLGNILYEVKVDRDLIFCVDKVVMLSDGSENKYNVVKFNCPVIRCSFGRHGREKAEELCKKTDCVVVYDYSWNNGFGSGIEFPVGFKFSDIALLKE